MALDAIQDYGIDPTTEDLPIIDPDKKSEWNNENIESPKKVLWKNILKRQI